MDVICPHCKTTFRRVPRRLCGEVKPCQECGNPFKIPVLEGKVRLAPQRHRANNDIMMALATIVIVGIASAVLAFLYFKIQR